MKVVLVNNKKEFKCTKRASNVTMSNRPMYLSSESGHQRRYILRYNLLETGSFAETQDRKYTCQPQNKDSNLAHRKYATEIYMMKIKPIILLAI